MVYPTPLNCQLTFPRSYFYVMHLSYNDAETRSRIRRRPEFTRFRGDALLPFEWFVYILRFHSSLPYFSLTRREEASSSC